jgi:hypothetical protein
MAKGSSPYTYAGLLGAFNTPPAPPPNEEECFAALGKFIASYASAEHSVHTVARRLSRLTDAKARIIFGGMRLGDLTERIRGLLRATKASDKKYNEIDACLIQLDLIADQRNKLVHRWVHYFDGQILASNAGTAKVVSSTETTFFKIGDFSDMEGDCIAISYRLMHVGTKKLNPATMKWARWPWRYKPAPPGTGPKPPHKAHQSPKPRPPSSRERREAAMKKRDS